MRHGNWIPLDKNLVEKLPTDRQFTELEAMFSLNYNYDCGVTVSIAGLASRWKWNRKRVRRFLEQVGVEISYRHDTSKRQNQKGQIQGQMRDRSKPEKGQIRFIDSKDIASKRDRSPMEAGQMRDRSRDTISNPVNPEPKNIVEKTNDSRSHVPVMEIIEYLNEKTGRSYRHNTQKTQSLIKARFREGFTLDDFRTVIDHKAIDWMSNAEMSLYLRPETLFGQKFEGYLETAKSQGAASRSCSLCRYNQAEPCRNFSLAGFDPTTCDSYQREMQA